MPKKIPAAPSAPPRFAIAIMAAGKGTRLKSKRPKVLHHIAGRPLLEHVIRAAAQVVRAEDIFVIVGHEEERVREAVAPLGVNFVTQSPQLGTGHAVMCARDAVDGYDGLLVLSGDAPLIRPQTIALLRDFHIGQRAAMTILTASPHDPTGYGRIVRKRRGSDEVTAIVEPKGLKGSQAKLGEINSGIYAFATAALFGNIDRLTTNNPHAEYYLTDMAAQLVKKKARVQALMTDWPAEVLGANTIRELAELDATLRLRKCHQLMAAGVAIYRPETCVIDLDVTVGADTVIEPFVQLLGDTAVGEDCRIRSFSVLENANVAENVTIRQGSIIVDSSIASSAVIGPYSHVRPGCEIGEGAHLGNFVETKKVRIGRGSKARHLTYLGDAEIGAGVNVGAGTIICNYDGVHKHTTVIGDGVFVGSDSTLVAPVRLGKGSYVAAASCVTEDVPEDALAIGRTRQVNKEGWARERRASVRKS